MQEINARELAQRLEKEEILNLLDVREEFEYHSYNIGGTNVPLSRLQQSLDQINYNKTDEIIVMCKVGLRSETACNILTANGYQQVKNLTGGLIAIQKLKQ